MSETKFQVNDEVDWAGCAGTVISIHAGPLLPVRVTFHERDVESCFTLDGRYVPWHKEPLLKLIERPKKKVTKTMYQVICRNSIEASHLYIQNVLFPSEAEARYRLGNNFVSLGPAITFEVEE